MKIYSALVVAIALLLGHSAWGAERNTGPWDTKHLSIAPKAEWGKQAGDLQEVSFAGEPYQGQPTRVFAYYARPEGDGPFPAMVLLHGGGGKAFAEWAKLWAARGYVALAIDLAGHGPDGKRLPEGGPNQDDKSKFRDFDDATLRDMWTYHAVANAMLGHSLLAAQKDVDPKRIGVTGISWGGYLTCIVAGVDERFGVAVPVYGCGFIHENSCWVDSHFSKMSAAQRERWVKHFDPSSYLAGVHCPILFVNGTNDFAYPPDSYHKSYSLVDRKYRHLRITVNMPHGHQQGWAPKEIGVFVDSVLKSGTPLGKVLQATSLIGGTGVEDRYVVESPAGVIGAQLHYTTGSGPWQKRSWASEEVKLTFLDAGARIYHRPLEDATYFFTVQDERGLTVSSELYGKRE